MSELSIIPVSGPEITTGLSFEVTLSDVAPTDVSVGLLLLSDTAYMPEVDFNYAAAAPLSTIVTIPAGERSITVPVAHNSGFGEGAAGGEEIDEAYTLEAFNPGGATFSGGADFYRITNVIESGGRALFVSDPVVVENDRGSHEVLFEVRLSRPADDSITVAYETRDGTAKADLDYVATDGELTFAAGETVKYVRTAVKGDTLAEISETFSLYVAPDEASAGLVNRPEADAVGTALIVDDDTSQRVPVLTMEASSGPEGYAVGRPVLFRLSEPASSDVTFTLTAQSQTADLPSDADFNYAAGASLSQVVTIPAGSFTFWWADIFHNDAGGAEPDEGYTLRATDIEGAVFSGDVDSLTQTAVILDSGRAVFVSDPTFREGDEGVTTAVFEVRVSRAADRQMVFDYNTLEGTAQERRDYVPQDGRLRFDPGETVKYVEVEVTTDRENEAAETFSLRVEPTPGTGQILADGGGKTVGTATIQNDDPVLNKINGRKGADTLRGTEDGDRLDGKAGHDLLQAGGGNDQLFGGSGNDTLQGGPGADYLDGGKGFDIVDYSDSGSRVVVTLEPARFGGGTAQNDQIAGIEGVSGSDFNDILRGSSGDDWLAGAGANDKIFGRDGDDTLDGGEGRDKIRGGDGDDLIEGGAGADKLFGEAGADSFVLRAKGQRDKIMDFDPSEDLLLVEADLVGGLRDGAEIVAEYARDKGDKVLLAFDKGTSALFGGIDDADLLSDAIMVI